MSDQRVISAANLRYIEQSLNTLEHSQAALHNTVHAVSTDQAAARSELAELRRAFAEFLYRDGLAKHLQLAQTQIIGVRQELETNYGHFSEVRRNTIGALQAMDAGIVTQATIQQASEELMLSTPRYWLAPALVALAAWIRNDRALAERALAEAIRRDNDKTSLFFALALRRHQRNAAAARWIHQYVVRQDASALSREFTVILDAVATGALGLEARPLVMDHLSSWHERLCGDEATVAAQVDRWKQLIDGMRTPVDASFTVLPKVSPTWPQLKELYEGATVHGRAEAFFRQLFHGPVKQSDDLRERVDGILDHLVEDYDVEEAPLRRQEAELRATIAAGGDQKAAAAAIAAQSAAHDSSTDFLTLLTNAAFFPDQVGASAGTQRFAIALARNWIVEADGRLEATNLTKLPNAVKIRVDGWQGTIDEKATEKALVQSLHRRIDEETERAVAEVRFTGGPLAAAIGCGLVGVLAVLQAIQGNAVFAVLLFVVAVLAGAWSYQQYQLLPQRRADLRQAGEQRKKVGAAQVLGAVAETVDLRSRWETERVKAESFRQYMQTLSSDAFIANAPDQVRGVMH